MARQVLTAVPNAIAALPLMAANRLSFAQLPQQPTHDVVISLTSHGKRLRHAHLTIESLARGTMTAPIILWLDKKDYVEPLPAPLQRLVSRGLHVRCSDGEYGPHTKYWPMFRSTSARVVTVDDDIIYPEWFLERLLAAAAPGTVTAYRAHEIVLNDDSIAPYRSWTPARSTYPSKKYFATGVGGVLYPRSFIDHVVAAGDSFMHTCPRADDIWLHVSALRSGHTIRQVYSDPQNFPVNPLAHRDSLIIKNLSGGNDEQIAATYTSEDLDRLKDSSALSAQDPVR